MTGPELIVIVYFAIRYLGRLRSTVVLVAVLIWSIDHLHIYREPRPAQNAACEVGIYA